MNMKQMMVMLACAVMVAIGAQSGIGAESGAQSFGSEPSGVTLAAAVDINQADTQTLIELPGIGEKTAERINDYRIEHGPFKSVDELLNVKGIGPKVLEKIRPLVRVS